MNTTLRTLIFDSGLSQAEFAKKVGVPYRTLMSQLTKENTIDLAFKYSRILGIDSVKGYECGVYVELVVGLKR